MAEEAAQIVLSTSLIGSQQSTVNIASIDLEREEMPGSAKSETEQPSSIGFLDLPFEIRHEIYSYLFDSAKISHDPPHLQRVLSGPKICSCLFPHQLVHTCRQIRDEALPLLLSATTIEVASSFNGIQPMPERYLDHINHAVVLEAKKFSPQLDNLDKWKCLKVLELRNLTVWCKFYDEIFLRSPQADEPMYALALFNLKRMSPTLCAWVLEPKPFNIHLWAEFVMNSLAEETVVGKIF